MRKHLLSNWVNIVGVIIGMYLITLFMASSQLFTDNRRFTFETVVVETMGGSIMYTFGAIVYNLKPILIIVIVLFIVDTLLYYLLKEKIKLILMLEVLIFTSLFLTYCLMEQSFNFLVLPITFIVTQWIRKKKLFKENK